MNRLKPYRPQPAQTPADPHRGGPCDTRDPRRHVSPAHPILNSSFLILNWTYTFSAKEKDFETGLSYFGSRYYSSDLSIWLSVDPMAAKYPSLSPYVYCADNPVRLVDPDGESVWIIGDDGRRYQYKNDGLLYCSDGTLYQGDDAFARSSQSSLKELQSKSPTANNILSNFVENESNDIEIKKKVDDVGFVFDGYSTTKYDNGESKTTTHGSIFWNPQGESIPTVDGMQQNGTTDLIHEFAHALDKVNNKVLNEEKYRNIPCKEWTATYYENIVRDEMNIPLREYYYKKSLGPNIYEGTGKSILRDGKPWIPRNASKLF